MKLKKIFKIVVCFILLILFIIILVNLYNDYRVKHAKKIVKLSTDEVEVFSDVKVSDIISKINGKIIDDKKIDTTKVGKEEISFKYINDDNITIDYTIDINIVDTTPPIISGITSYSVEKGSDDDIVSNLFCGDNYDAHPKCSIEGDYNVNKVGTYSVTLKGEDSSNNVSSHDMDIVVYKKSKTKNKFNNNQSDITDNSVAFSDVVEKYKSKNTQIGIDVSHWQGDINFKKVKKAGVEFVYIRVGRGDGIGKDYVLDDKFKQNIEGFNKVGIPVGVYFYSYANSKSDAIKEAKWVIKQIKKYDVSLEIVFDWEDWNNFQEYDLSFYTLTEAASAFTDAVEDAGYSGMVYSSKSYLESMWYPIKSNVWLAHYTENTDYEGKYKVWQVCSNGIVTGISDNQVDINVRYKKSN